MSIIYDERKACERQIKKVRGPIETAIQFRTTVNPAGGDPVGMVGIRKKE